MAMNRRDFLKAATAFATTALVGLRGAVEALATIPPKTIIGIARIYDRALTDAEIEELWAAYYAGELYRYPSSWHLFEAQPLERD